MRRIAAEERRARLGLRHFLARETRGGGDLARVAGGLVGLHATDPASVYLAARARLHDPGRDAIDDALYERRSVVRVLGMRRTMFVLPLEAAGVVQAACTEAIAAAMKRRYAKLIEQGGVAADGAAWLAEAADATVAALAARGEAFGSDLSKEVPQLREKLRIGEGSRWEASITLTTWVLFVLAAEGRIVRGRPRGGWTSSQWRWAPTETWLAEPLPRFEPEEARAELARRWLKAFGPARVDDLKWWTGWNLGHTRAALASAGAVEVELDGSPGVALPDDLEPVPPPEPWAAFLPALDPTVMGWKERSWYLGEHAPALFDRSGNAGPTVWWDGRIVGGWTTRKDDDLAFRLLEDVGAEAETAIEAEASRVTGWLDGSSVQPRFKTPLQRELAA